ncbi:MAG: hypothetical protein HMLKMBBP_01660 [Planctomycetes bacterium]|nr:hypothetical protein [Planctomycetota bacterium]
MGRHARHEAANGVSTSTVRAQTLVPSSDTCPSSAIPASRQSWSTCTRSSDISFQCLVRRLQILSWSGRSEPTSVRNSRRSSPAISILRDETTPGSTSRAGARPSCAGRTEAVPSVCRTSRRSPRGPRPPSEPCGSSAPGGPTGPSVATRAGRTPPGPDSTRETRSTTSPDQRPRRRSGSAPNRSPRHQKIGSWLRRIGWVGIGEPGGGRAAGCASIPPRRRCAASDAKRRACEAQTGAASCFPARTAKRQCSPHGLHTPPRRQREIPGTTESCVDGA